MAATITSCPDCAAYGLTAVRISPDGVCAYGHRAAPGPSWLEAGRIATRFVCGLLTAAEAVTLLQRAGCTEQDAWDRLAEWQKPVTSFIDPDDEYRQERADFDA